MCYKCYPLNSNSPHEKIIILIGRKYFSNCVVQSNYLIIPTELLTALFFKKNIEAKDCSKFVKTQKKWFICLKFEKKNCKNQTLRRK